MSESAFWIAVAVIVVGLPAALIAVAGPQQRGLMVPPAAVVSEEDDPPFGPRMPGLPRIYSGF